MMLGQNIIGHEEAERRRREEEEERRRQKADDDEHYNKFRRGLLNRYNNLRP